MADVKIGKFLILQIGEKAPPIKAQTLAGETFKLSELEGRVVLVDFWATWCMPCIAEMPNVRRVHDKYAADGHFVVVGLSMDEDGTLVKRFVKDNAPWTHIVAGPADSSPIAREYNVTAIPAMFLIDHTGRIAARDVMGPMLEWEVSKLVKKARADDPTRKTAQAD